VDGFRKIWISQVLLISLLGSALAADSARADSATQIRLVCESNWPDLEREQRECRKVQFAAADRLLMRIEAAPEISLEFSLAKSCIERAKVKQPSMVDWVKALTCFKNRTREPGATE